MNNAHVILKTRRSMLFFTRLYQTGPREGLSLSDTYIPRDGVCETVWGFVLWALDFYVYVWERVKFLRQSIA